MKATKVSVQDAVATGTLNRPEALNAVDHVMHLELEEVLALVAEDQDVNAVVLTGAGKAFSAGGDIKAMQARARDPEEHRGCHGKIDDAFIRRI